MTVNIETILLSALGLQGKPYIFGFEINPREQNPGASDCSEAVQWACTHNGLEMVDGAANQYAYCRGHGTDISVHDALKTRGALMFITEPNGHIGHVVFSLGNGSTMEAKGHAYGCGIFSAYKADGHTPRFDKAARIPGVDYGHHPLLAPPKDGQATGELLMPDHRGGWRVHMDGGVFTWGTAPFYGSYPGLPPKDREGTRSFPGPHAIQARDDGKPGYMLTSNHSERYRFGPDTVH